MSFQFNLLFVKGWITAFCVYDSSGEWTTRKGTPRVDSNKIPGGIVSVPVEVDDNGSKYNTLCMLISCVYFVHICLFFFFFFCKGHGSGYTIAPG